MKWTRSQERNKFPIIREVHVLLAGWLLGNLTKGIIKMVVKLDKL